MRPTLLSNSVAPGDANVRCRASVGACALRGLARPRLCSPRTRPGMVLLTSSGRGASWDRPRPTSPDGSSQHRVGGGWLGLWLMVELTANSRRASVHPSHVHNLAERRVLGGDAPLIEGRADPFAQDDHRPRLKHAAAECGFFQPSRTATTASGHSTVSSFTGFCPCIREPGAPPCADVLKQRPPDGPVAAQLGDW